MAKFFAKVTTQSEIPINTSLGNISTESVNYWTRNLACLRNESFPKAIRKCREQERLNTKWAQGSFSHELDQWISNKRSGNCLWIILPLCISDNRGCSIHYIRKVFTPNMFPVWTPYSVSRLGQLDLELVSGDIWKL